VYVPATTTELAVLVETSEVGRAPLTAFAVTDALRAWYSDSNDEELEYAAMSEAARASLRLLDADPTAARRRVVIAVDVADSAVEVRDDLDRGVVRLGVPVAMSHVASVHVDDTDASGVIARAAAAIGAADLGDIEAQDAVDDAEGFDLSWYASQEIGPLLEIG
jgi:hypothetical protein